MLQRPPNTFFTTPCVANCGYFLNPAELQEIAGKVTFEKMQLRATRAAIDAHTYHCPILDCEYIGFWLGEEEEDEFPSDVCDGCNKSRCILCGIIPFHTGKTCGEAQESLTQSTESILTAADIAKHRVKRCPSCREGIQKVSRTCNKMHCRWCGYKYCFKCGTKDSKCRCTSDEHTFWDNIRDDIMEEDEEIESLSQGPVVAKTALVDGTSQSKMLQRGTQISLKPQAAVIAEVYGYNSASSQGNKTRSEVMQDLLKTFLANIAICRGGFLSLTFFLGQAAAIDDIGSVSPLSSGPQGTISKPTVAPAPAHAAGLKRKYSESGKSDRQQKKQRPVIVSLQQFSCLPTVAI